MAKENLETRVKKAIFTIEKKVVGIYDVLTDLSLKLCHIIRDGKKYYRNYNKDLDRKGYFI